MVRVELAETVSASWLDHPVAAGGSLPGSIVDGFWCPIMRANGNGLEVRKNASSATEPVCGKLRTMFEDVASEPMPDSMASLADRLERAFERGELFAPKPKR